MADRQTDGQTSFQLYIVDLTLLQKLFVVVIGVKFQVVNTVTVTDFKLNSLLICKNKYFCIDKLHGTPPYVSVLIANQH